MGLFSCAHYVTIPTSYTYIASYLSYLASSNSQLFQLPTSYSYSYVFHAAICKPYRACSMFIIPYSQLFSRVIGMLIKSPNKKLMCSIKYTTHTIPAQSQQHSPSQQTQAKVTFDLLTHYKTKQFLTQPFSLYLICKHFALGCCVYKSDTKLMDVQPYT